MTKKEALEIFGGDANALQNYLGISRQAFHQWGKGEIPLLRSYQVQEYARSLKAK